MRRLVYRLMWVSGPVGRWAFRRVMSDPWVVDLIRREMRKVAGA